MVSRAPRPAEALTNMRQANGNPVQRKGGQEVAVQSKRAGAGQKPTQDMAELKDFVGHGTD